MRCWQCQIPTFGALCSRCSGEPHLGGPPPVDPVLEALKAIVEAWEKLPGGMSYTPRIVGDWLIKDMKPAIDRARKALGEDDA